MAYQEHTWRDSILLSGITQSVDKFLGVFVVVVMMLGPVLQARADAIDDLQPGHWYRVPNSKLRSVTPANYPGGNTGYEAIMIAWNGGAFDSVRDKLIVWGGGHSDYAGNEIYAFDLDTLSWQRLTDPSEPSGGSQSGGTYGDGRPRSAHTYNALSFSPETGKFYFMGLGSVWSSGQQSHYAGAFNFTASKWEAIASKPVIGGVDASVAAYDSATGYIWVQHGADKRMSFYDPAQNSWNTFAAWSGGPSIDLYATAALSAVDRQMVAVGDGQMYVWDLSDTTSVLVPEIKGPASVVNKNAPGFVYDQKTGQYVGWIGGSDIYTLNPDTLEWRRITPPATNTVVPTNPSSQGTYGRFRYSPNRNVFVVVNSIDEDVYVYRLSEGAGSPSESGGQSSFSSLCGNAGVVKCVGFDSSNEISADLIPDGSGKIYPEIDTTQSASGAASLKLTIPPFSDANSSGAYMSTLGDTFGQNESFFVTFKQRFSKEMVETSFGGDGWKQVILHSAGSSCAAVEITTQNVWHRGFPQLYSSCGADHFSVDLPNGDILLQQGDYECHYQNMNPSDCSMYRADQWITFYYEIRIGDWGQPNSSVRAYIAYEGQLLRRFIDIDNYTLYFNDSPSDTFAMIQLTPYNTNKPSSRSHPTAYIWYDDLIVSRQPIYALGSTPLNRPMPPEALLVE